MLSVSSYRNTMHHLYSFCFSVSDGMHYVRPLLPVNMDLWSNRSKTTLIDLSSAVRVYRVRFEQNSKDKDHRYLDPLDESARSKSIEIDWSI